MNVSAGLSLCWRGPPGGGKRHALQTQLRLWAASLGQLYVLKRQLWDAPLQGGESAEGGADTEADVAADAAAAADAKALLPMECSVLHWGFDVARMSLQDKQHVRSILARWGRGSHVLAAEKTARCLVFYHAHLLSSESILFLQAFLEENHHDTVLWLTSEHPLPPRLSDWCLEIPVPGLDRALPSGVRSKTLQEEITILYSLWMTSQPTLADVKKIRAVVYALLHRRRVCGATLHGAWTDCSILSYSHSLGELFAKSARGLGSCSCQYTFYNTSKAEQCSCLILLSPR